MKKKKITIINQDAGYLMIDIANAFHDAGYEVNLIAGRLVQRNKSLNQGIKFVKICRYKRNSTFKRLFTWSLGFLQTLFHVFFRFRKHRLLIVTNPPLTIFLPLFTRNPYSFLIYDIYPDVLVDSGFMGDKSLLIKFWQKVNRSVFARAKGIVTLSESMKSVTANYVDPGKIEVIPIWTDNNNLRPVLPEQNPFVREHGLTGKFVIMYSGNMGYSHKLHKLINVASNVYYEDILFLFIGDGDQKERIAREIQKKGLDNCKMLPWQSPELLPYSLAAGSVGVVSIGKESSRYSVPSKTYDLMAVGVPLLCLTPENSELEKIVQTHENGKAFNHESVDEIREYIEKLYKDATYYKYMSNNSLTASEQYSPDNAKLFVD